MKQKILLASIVMLTLACNVLGTPTPTDSGISGQALMGPMCPAMREGEECPDMPYQATITVNNLEGRKIVQFKTDKVGYFQVPLAPGEYILHPETPERKPFPYADEQRFTVLPGEFTQIIVSYDSGIR